jgi:indolepyruvate ferredoxin oxidoreductase alpha subunit
MSSFSDSMVQKEPWAGLMMGNHALARAMLEAGVMVATHYPGSPTPEIADALLAIPEDQRPLHFEFSTNEKVALETAFGASINGHLSTVFFKSVGLNVALDSAIQLSLLDLTGGMVVILGDDPGVNSSQNEQDNRHIARMGYAPMYEPATPSEAYAMFLEAAELSRRLKMPVFLRLTTHVCHAREVVQFGAIPEYDYDWTPRYNPGHMEYWPITANVFPLKRRALAKLSAAEKHAETSRFTETVSPNGSTPIGGKRLGIIVSGLPATAVRENLDESGASLDVLKLGITHPLPHGRLLEFLRAHDEVLLVEELDRILEPELKALSYDNQIACQLRVRADTEMLMGEFGPARTWALLSQTWPDIFPPHSWQPAPVPGAGAAAPRLPQMCPGCGHRSAFYAIRELLVKEYPGAITVADIGCHSLGAMEPYEMGTVLLCMGHSSGTGAGLSIGNTGRKVVAFIGDSTFFHAGLPAIINATLHNHNLTLVILENYTTAMTGHQPTPNSGELGDKIQIPAILEALGVKFLKSIDAYKQAELQDIMREALAFEGFAVVIAKHPCMLKFLRDKRRKLAARNVGAPAR